MPITLSNLTSNRRKCLVTYHGDEANITYKPSAYTPLLEDELHEALSGNRPALALKRVLLKVVDVWDLVDENGKQVPPTDELLSNLPNDFLVAVSNAIVEDMSKGSTLKNSDVGSFPAVK